MAAFNKFENFVNGLCTEGHQLHTDTLKVFLTNSAPSASADSVYTDLTDLSTANGYTAGGVDTLNTFAEANGTGTLTGTKCVVTASGAVGPFQYVVLWNDTNATDDLIGWWDYAGALTLANGETFSVKFNNSDTTGTILTVA